jgi:hypothetical protein
MFMKKILLASTLAIAVNGYSQLKIENATFFIGAGATVTVQGDVTSNVDIQGTGLLQLKGTSLQNVDMGGNLIPNLELDNTANATLLNTGTRIGTNMNFVNGRFLLGTQSLTITTAATITGNNSSRFVITNGTGVLTKQALAATAFTYPVGFSSTEYNPLMIANTGTADDISTRCLQDVLDNGLTGSPVLTDFANNSWVVTEAIAGGSNLALTGEWVTGDELAGFNRVKSGVAKYNTGTDWDLPASNVLGATGGGPYTRNRSSIIAPGVFAVADLEKVNAARLNLRVFLQGNYNATTGLMGDLLRDDPVTGGVDPVIPTTQPYSSALNARFTRAGIYDGSASVNETVNASVFNTTGNNAIVDWVYISTLDATTPSAKLQTRAALLQRDGDIVDVDGTSPVLIPIDGDANYHILIGHRNHLSIRTPAAQGLADNVTFGLYNFTDLQSKAFQAGVAIPTNLAMADMAGTFPGKAMWGGNVNANVNVRYSLGSNDNLSLLTILGGNTTITLTPLYSLGDINLDRRVRYSLGSNDNLALLSILGGNTTLTITEHQ